MDNKITIGSRGSKLSLAYANKVKNLISNVDKITGNKIKIEVIKTSGDLFKDKKISEIGGKNLFCKEIEDKLIKKEIDIAIHSLKEMFDQAINKSKKIPLKLLNELLITMKKGSLCALCGAIPVPIMNILKYFSDEMKSDIVQEN